MPQYNEEIDEFTVEMRSAIENALHEPEIMKRLRTRRYTETRMKEGLDECADLEQKHLTQKQEYADKFAATTTVRDLFRRMRRVFGELYDYGRRAFAADGDMYTRLGLQGARQDSQIGYLAQARQFVTAALESKKAREGLDYYGIDTAYLKDAKHLTNEMAEALRDRMKETAEAEEATRIRDEAYDRARTWHGNFQTVADHVLDDVPQLKEQVGIQVP